MSFNICVVKNPIMIFDERRQCEVTLWNESEGDRVLDFNFEYDDFESLQNFLNVKLLSVEQQEDESYADYDRRLENDYLDSARGKGFPMLGRIWNWYYCATYFSSEISGLEAECLRIKNDAPDANLSAAVGKILAGCEEAAKTNSGLEFASD